MKLTRRASLVSLLAAPALLSGTRLIAAPVIEVAGSDELSDALQAAVPGTVLRLAPGDYGTLFLRGGGGTIDAPVMLVAGDPTRPPRIGILDMHGVENLVLDGLHFSYRFKAGDELYFRPFQIVASSGIYIRGCRFEGDVAAGRGRADNGFPTAFGLTFTDCSGSRLEGCEIFRFFRGFFAAQSRDIVVRDNDIHSARMDGMNFTEVQRLLIEGNHVHDFDRSVASDDHPDMIQFWTNQTKAPSTDVVIRGNLLSSGRGAWTQSIFMRNEEVDTGRAGREMFYRNVLIEENAILNAHLHGISVGETLGLMIRNNTVVRNPASEGSTPNPPLWTPRINVSETSRDVTIERNVVAEISGWTGQSTWKVADNMLVQDRTRTEPGFYDTVFAGDPADSKNFAYRKGGPLDGAGLGAHRFQR